MGGCNGSRLHRSGAIGSREDFWGVGKMRERAGIRPWPRRFGIFVALLVLAALSVAKVPGARAKTGAESVHSALSSADSIASGQLIQPEDLARVLADSTTRQPVVLQVGFKVLFRSGHIPGSRFIGPASKPEGLAALKRALRKIPRAQAVVLYCGCCPWADCPNVRPAFRAAREMGHRNVRVLYVGRNLQHDWVEKGLPIGQGDQ